MSIVLTGAAVLVAMFALAAVMLWLADRIRYRTPSQEETEEQSRDYRRRLLDPNWALVAVSFGGEVPAAVAALYSDARLLEGSSLRIDDDIEVAYFVPADADAFDPEQWFNPADDAFVFALTLFGDPFFVRTSELAAGLPVYLHYHDGGDTEIVSSGLEEFVDRLRRSLQAPIRS